MDEIKEKTFSVSAIKNGTVIDHITAGRALPIINLLKLSFANKRVTIGLNLPSSSMSNKDIIKVHDKALSEEEANQVAIFSPQATISIIRDFEISRKYKVAIPDILQKTPLRCPNPKCISNHEPMSTFFYIVKQVHNVMLNCKYCEKIFTQNEMRGV